MVRSEIIVIVSGLAMLETIVRDITLITAASKDLKLPNVCKLFSNHYFRLCTNADVVGVETADCPLKILSLSELGLAYTA